MTANSSLNQWVELLDLSDACLMRPETCGAEGASLTAWIKVFKYYSKIRIISSRAQFSYTTGILINRYLSRIK